MIDDDDDISDLCLPVVAPNPTQEEKQNKTPLRDAWTEETRTRSLEKEQSRKRSIVNVINHDNENLEEDFLDTPWVPPSTGLVLFYGKYIYFLQFPLIFRIVGRKIPI